MGPYRRSYQTQVKSGNVFDEEALMGSSWLAHLAVITWVVRCMADMPASSPDQLIGGKHAQEDEPDTSIKKRYVLSFSISSQANGANVTGEK